MQYAKLTLLALVICAALGAATAGPLLRGETGPSPIPDVVDVPRDNSGPGSVQNARCILVINTCPTDNPRCGKEPLQVTVSCSDPSCVPGSCISAEGASTSASPTLQTIGSDPSNSCMLRRFECPKGSLYSCFKRWRSKSINCSDNACSGDTCMKSDIFFGTYTLQPWDIAPLQGPFPRTETMCVIQRSSCAPDDTSCLSAVSLEQIPCGDRACDANTCMRSTVLVDQNDILVRTSTDENSGSNSTGGTDSVSQNSSRAQNTSTATSSAIQERTQNLGCFDASGVWTTDRTKCAANQQPYVQPEKSGSNEGSGKSEDNPESRKEAERKIEEKFVPDTRRTALAQNLLSSTTEAVGRISRMLENPSLPSPSRILLEQKQEELRAAQRAVTGEQSVRELQELADGISDDLTSVQETARQLGTAPVSPPLSVTGRLDRIFAQLPSIFGLLLNEGVPVDSMTIDAYLAAQTVYDDVGVTCIAQPDTCGSLVEVIDALEPVFAGLRLSLETAGRTDLESQIDLLLE